MSKKAFEQHLPIRCWQIQNVINRYRYRYRTYRYRTKILCRTWVCWTNLGLGSKQELGAVCHMQPEHKGLLRIVVGCLNSSLGNKDHSINMLFYSGERQCYGSGSLLDPNSIVFWIRIQVPVLKKKFKNVLVFTYKKALVIWWKMAH